MASIERALVSWQIKQWPQGKPKRYGVIRQSARRGGGYAPRRGAKRNAGADDGCVTNVHSARARLVSDLRVHKREGHLQASGCSPLSLLTFFAAA
jgi:hypothetical protein